LLALRSQVFSIARETARSDGRDPRSSILESALDASLDPGWVDVGNCACGCAIPAHGCSATNVGSTSGPIGSSSAAWFDGVEANAHAIPVLRPSPTLGSNGYRAGTVAMAPCFAARRECHRAPAGSQHSVGSGLSAGATAPDGRPTYSRSPATCGKKLPPFRCDENLAFFPALRFDNRSVARPGYENRIGRSNSP
jgi:hypothetical protein